MRFLAAIVQWICKLAERFRACALVRQRLPRGVAASRLRPALRAPHDPSGDGFETVQLGAQVVRGAAPRPLLRLRALRQHSPVSLVDPRAFRLDPSTLTWANEDGIPVATGLFEHGWLDPAFRRDVLDRGWISSRPIFGLAPLQPEWFASWWWQHKARPVGANGPRNFETPPDLPELMQRVKEQMLIRRDVGKDENPPKPASLERSGAEPLISLHARTDMTELVPAKEWPDGAPPREPAISPSSATDEAYQQWRVLMDALGE